MPVDPPDRLPDDGRVTAIEHETTSPTARDRPDPCHFCGAMFSPASDPHTKAAIILPATVEWANRSYSRARFCNGECFKQWLERGL